MEMRVTACDPEKERSRKILPPEIDPAQGFWIFALARVLFAGSKFFEVFVHCGLSRHQMVGVAQIFEKVASPPIFLDFGGPAGSSCTRTSAFAPMV